MVVKKKKNVANNSTNFSLQVESTAQEEIFDFDKDRIVKALIEEVECSVEIANEVADKVTERLSKTNTEILTPCLIRSFVNVVLCELGYKEQLHSNSEITISTNDIKGLIFNTDRNSGNVSHNPEGINLSIAENVMKQYALKTLVPKETAKKHLKGDIHIHDLGMINRFYCSGHNPEYIKRYGIRGMKNIPTYSAPAGTAWTAVRHIASATMFFTSLFAGAIGYDAINMFLAPYTRGWTEDKYVQLAQTLLYDFSQLAGAKGGQVSFTDFNIYAVTPKFYEETYAVGAKGCYMFENSNGTITYIYDKNERNEYASTHSGKLLTYKDFEPETQSICKALLKVTEHGDLRHMPFGFPKIHFHINQDVLDDANGKKLFNYACEVLAKTGNPYIDFDRNAAGMSQCCRLVLEFDNEDLELTKTPEELRFCGGQNVSINLANIPLSTSNEEEFYKELKLRMDMCAEMHKIKLDYVKSIAVCPDSSLEFYEHGSDGKPYIKYDKISWLIGMVGLNECVYNLTGKQLHESKSAFLKGLEVITWMNEYSHRLSEQYGMTMKLEESPAESTSGRFAKLDRKYYKNAYMKGEGDGVYYSNSIHFPVDAHIDYIDELKYQSKFHTLVEAGSMIHIWIGDKAPSPEAVENTILNAWYNTKCTEMTLSPNETVCNDCNTTVNKFFDECPICNSKNIFWNARITGYNVPVYMFNASKLAELNDRIKHNINDTEVSINFLCDDLNDYDYNNAFYLTIYSKPNCPNCKAVKKFLDENNINYINYDVTSDYKAKARLILEGKEMLPVIQMDRKFIEFDRNKFDEIKKEMVEYSTDEI